MFTTPIFECDKQNQNQNFDKKYFGGLMPRMDYFLLHKTSIFMQEKKYSHIAIIQLRQMQTFLCGIEICMKNKLEPDLT